MVTLIALNSGRELRRARRELRRASANPAQRAPRDDELQRHPRVEPAPDALSI